MITQWHGAYDVIVVGSGAAGFTAAITAKKHSLSVLLIEKTAKYGGSTALSGGAIWVPNNIYLQEAGVIDTFENAKEYLDATIGDSSTKDLQRAYLSRGPDMVKYLRDNTHVKWSYIKGYSDYYPNLPGGKPEGRSIEAQLFDLRRLGDAYKTMRRSQMPTRGMVLSASEFHKVNMATRTWKGFRTAIRIGLRFIHERISFYKPASLGEALIGRLMLSYKEVNGKIWLSSSFKKLIKNTNGDIIGVTIRKKGKNINLKVIKGVIFAAGGFSHSQELREKYLQKPTKTDWTLASEEQTGDIIKEAVDAGAALNLMNKVWGTPTSIPPNSPAYMPVAERALPGTIIVDSKGQRYVNESVPYHEFVDKMYQHNAKNGENKSIPSWYIFDQQVKNRYPIFGILPRFSIPKKWLESGFTKKAKSIEELASMINVSSENLTQTIDRFNIFAEEGLDIDFNRGNSAYENFYGDPRLKNPNLAPIEKSPFYAIPLYPGDIGTKGGIRIDEYGRALNEHNMPINKLYVAGNSSASMMGTNYPGPGATIGPAMFFGYSAAMHIVKKKR